MKIEGRQRSPAYVAKVTRVWRQALDSSNAGLGSYSARPEWLAQLAEVSEGHQCTLGAYHREWK